METCSECRIFGNRFGVYEIIFFKSRTFNRGALSDFSFYVRLDTYPLGSLALEEGS